MPLHALHLAGALLGQIPTLKAPPPLPAAPFFERFFLEQPIGLVAGLVLAAVVVYVVFNRKGKTRQGAAAGAGILVLAVLAWMIADRVHTSREQMKAAAAQLIQATALYDEPELRRLLGDSIRFYSRFGPPGPAIPQAGTDRETLLTLIHTFLKERYQVKEYAILESQAVSDGPGMGRTQVRLRVTLQQVNFPHGSWWMIHWRRDAGGQWRATTIEPVEMQFFSTVR